MSSRAAFVTAKQNSNGNGHACLHFPMAATRKTRRAFHFDVASDPFKCHFGAFDVAVRYFEKILMNLVVMW